jgi:hypothetical protein
MKHKCVQTETYGNLTRVEVCACQTMRSQNGGSKRQLKARPGSTSALWLLNRIIADKVGLDRRVNFDMHGASMGEVGSLLAETADAEIYVPAHRIDERRDLYLEDVSLDMVVRQLGLLALVRP